MANITANASKNVYAPASSTYPYLLSVSLEETSYNYANNNSVIKITGSLYGKNISYSSTSANNLKIYWFDDNQNSNGTLIATLTVASIEKKETKTVTGTITASHNTDGKLKGYARVVFTKGVSNSYVPPTTTLDTANTSLTPIPRQTELASSSFYIGDVTALTLQPYVSSYTHILTFNVGNYSYSFSDTANNHVLAIDLTDAGQHLMSELYSVVTGDKLDVTATLTTKYGNTTIGTKTAVFTIKCLESRCKPTISASYEDLDTDVVAITGSNQKILKNRSNLKISINATSLNGASITKVLLNEVEVSDKTTYSTTKPSINSYSLVAYDSRGFKSDTYTLNVDLLDFITLTANAVFTRVAPTTGEVKVKYSGNYWNGNVNSTANTLNIKWYYKEHSDSSWILGGTLTPTISNNKYSGEESLSGTFNYKKAFDFKIDAEDLIDLIPSSDVVPRGEPMFWSNGSKFKFIDKAYFSSGNELLDYTIVDDTENTIKIEKFIDSTGIKHNGTLLKNYIQKNIRTIRVGSSNLTQTISTAWDKYTIPLTVSGGNVGNKLTFTNNSIKIGEGVSKVKITANTALSGISGDVMFFGILKNDSVQATANTPPSTYWSTISIAPLVINVVENDTISLYCGGARTGTLKIANGTYTYLTVEVVE